MNGARLSGGMMGLLLLLLPFKAPAVTVSSVAELQNAVIDANSGGDKNIILSSSGSPYNLGGVYLRLTADGITVSGSTGNREDVILDGQYVTTEIFQILGSYTTIKDLTLKRAYYHPVHIFPADGKNLVGTLLDNIHIIDPGQQAVKINQNHDKTYSANNGTIQNTRIELTAGGRAEVWNINGSCYTGGVDAHHANGWVVRNNVITGFWCDSGLSEHGVHFWSFSEDTLVERNLIVNCDRGIGFGLGSSGHTGGTIRNNMIYHDAGHAYSDVGIGLESASGAQVYNNTIFHVHSYPNAIEYRFSATAGGAIRNNLTNRAIASRNGGTAIITHNVTTARSSYFADVSNGDLHLAYKIPGVVNRGISLAGLTNDFDGDARPAGGSVDIGADELAEMINTSAEAAPWLYLLLD